LPFEYAISAAIDGRQMLLSSRYISFNSRLSLEAFLTVIRRQRGHFLATMISLNDLALSRQPSLHWSEFLTAFFITHFPSLFLPQPLQEEPGRLA